ncbi:MAG: exodeoxyribonuclease VII small subunit [Rikenellaceae bacterium]|nr:exodeoxyribonuclease VII small subunit [Rikenellaceae bacterium]
MAVKKEKNYSEAIKEVEDILTRLNNDDMDVDVLALEVKRAGELIELCKSKLRKAEEDVQKIIKDQE